MTASSERTEALTRLTNRASELTAQADELIQNGETEQATALLKLAEGYRDQARTFSRIQWELNDITIRASAAGLSSQ